MTRLAILEYPDARLRTRAEPVSTFDAELSTLVDDMLETLYAARGIGLAATQVDVHRQLLVMDVTPEANAPQVFINPTILERAVPGRVEESCLSLPGIFETVERATRIRVRTFDRHGVASQHELEGLAAVCLQHEMDHLAGKLFVDRLSFLQRWGAKRRLIREHRRVALAGPRV